MTAFAFWVFLAGLISFLSPCVLPLVPGYISMLSGLGVEQLKEGREASAKLFSSALAFVVGLSAVFVSMGATATAVGTFLLRNRSLLGPIAGALIVLFGLHLIGWLAKISIQVGIVVAAILVAFGDIRSLIRAATLLCVLCLPVSVLPQITNTSPESKANPVNQYKAHGYVNDFAGIIAPRFQSQLETISKELDQETQTQLAIVTVKSLEGLGIKDFATQLANRWGVGHQDTNRGILVLLAVKERQYRISVGLGLESVLTDEEADRLGKEMIPMLRTGNFATALLHLAKRLEVELPSKLK